MKVIVAVFLVNEPKKDIRNGGIKEDKNFTIIIEFIIFKQYYYTKSSFFIDAPFSPSFATLKEKGIAKIMTFLLPPSIILKGQ